MSDSSRKLQELAASERILHALKNAHAQLDALKRAKHEPIAIVGAGCRFPGGIVDLDSFWHVLCNGVDAITEAPPERWDVNAYYDPTPATPGKMYTRCGGFVAGIDRFDPQFFGISPREAASMDPQQRLLLEVAWEALEQAGSVHDRLNCSRTGVFIGIISSDYERVCLDRQHITELDAYMLTGNATNIAAGRIAYIFGFQGPCAAIDTACSSSLVALHLACQSLRNQECDQALAGGVNLVLLPEATVGVAQTRVLSPDGRCKGFAASADGYGRSEGCGLLVLKRLSDAQAAGDRILAMIRGSAINHDGASSGLTVPNGPAQEALIRQALAQAKLKPSQIDYLEAHGTGTPLGDPIEIGALAAVFAEGHSQEQPLFVGSVKSNIGHAESAAGIAGIFKALLSLMHKEIPPHLHFAQPNPHIDWEHIPIAIPTTLQPWPLRGDARRAGVSSFGFSGTNAHVILESAPECPVESHDAHMERPAHIITCSAKSEAALDDMLKRYASHLNTHPDLSLSDLAFSSNVGRGTHAHRAAVVADSLTQARQRFEAMLTETLPPGTMKGVCREDENPQIVFLFTGQGAQYSQMGRQLYATQPVFRQALEQCHEILRPLLDASLLDVLFSDSAQDRGKLDDTAYTQPALFALEYALATLWQSWGFRPAVVMGHSVGECAAACIAGIFSLEDGLKLIAARGRLMGGLPHDGEMFAVTASEALMSEMIAPYRADVSLAAINGPSGVTISGRRAAMQDITALMEQRGLRYTQLSVSHAFHSPLMQPILPEFGDEAKRVAFHAPRTKIVSNLTGSFITPFSGNIQQTGMSTPDYWVDHIRQPVRFNDGMTALLREGYQTFIEIGPKPVLCGMGRQIAENLDTAGKGAAAIRWLPSLRSAGTDWQQMLESLGHLYVSGAKVEWKEFDRPYPRKRVMLPSYPFQRQRYWLERQQPPGEIRPALSTIAHTGGHPLLGQRMNLADSQAIWFESQISPDFPAFLRHHRVFGEILLPAAAFIEMAIAAGFAVLNSDKLALESLILHQALMLREDAVTTIQIKLTPQKPNAHEFQVFSAASTHDHDDSGWILHASGKIAPLDHDREPKHAELAILQSRITNQVSVDRYYQTLRERGIAFGADFMSLDKAWNLEGEALGQIRLPEQAMTGASDFTLHPVLLDGCFQILGALLAAEKTSLSEGQSFVHLPVGVERLQLYRRPDRNAWGGAKLRPVQRGDSQTLMADLRLFTDNGQLVANIEGFQLKLANREDLLSSSQHFLTDWLYEVTWQPKPHEDRRLPGEFFPTADELAARLAPQIAQVFPPREAAVYKEVFDHLERLSAAHIMKAFREMGQGFSLSQRFSLETLAEQTGVVSQYRRLLKRLLEVLTEEGILRQTGDQWEVASQPDLCDPHEQAAAFLSKYPDARAEFALLDRCGSKLSEVLQGKCNPLPLLFPENEEITAASLYQDSAAAQAANEVIRRVFALLLERFPQNRRARILEIGAGTGGATSAILPYLSERETDYLFTDIAPLLVHQAREKFSPYPFLRYQVLDIERSPSDQGFDGQEQYDIILAANVLHATQNLRQTLQHVTQLLSPGGMLVLLEGTARLRFIDLIFGLTDGWWRFNDTDLRSSHPLISASRWRELLRECGFEETTVFSSHDENSLLAKQAIIVARANSNEQKILKHASQHWLILADHKGIGQQAGALLQEHGAICWLAQSAEIYKRTGAREFQISADNPADFQRVVEAIKTETPALHGVVHVWSADVEGAEDKALTAQELDRISQTGCGSVLHLLQAISNAGFQKPPSLWLVTSGAAPAEGAIGCPGLFQSSLWGMGKSIMLEHPELNCALVDLGVELSPEKAARRLFDDISDAGSENQIAHRAGRRYAARLTRLAKGKEQPQTLLGSPFRHDGMYLITGGLSGLGLLVAGWMVEKGVRHLTLVGRRVPDSAAVSQIREWEQAGAHIVIAQADVSNRDQIARVLADIDAVGIPLAGIVHSAGVLDDGVLLQLSWEQFARVLAPKMQGAWNLHTLTRSKELEMFVLFSSSASLLGSPAQANHAAANAFLDALAYYRCSHGLPGLSINWGAWTEIGAAVRHGTTERVRKKGMGTISPRRGLQILEQLLRRHTPQIGVVPIDWPAFLQQLSDKRPAFLTELVNETRQTMTIEPQPVREPQSFRQQFAAVAPEEREQLIMTFLRRQASRILRLDEASIAPDQALNSMGFDSLMAVELRNRVRTEVGAEIPVVKFMQGLNLHELAELVQQHLKGTLDETPESEATEISPNLNPAQAKKLLAKLDQLTDEEIEALWDAASADGGAE